MYWIQTSKIWNGLLFPICFTLQGTQTQLLFNIRCYSLTHILNKSSNIATHKQRVGFIFSGKFIFMFNLICLIELLNKRDNNRPTTGAYRRAAPTPGNISWPPYFEPWLTRAEARPVFQCRLLLLLLPATGQPSRAGVNTQHSPRLSQGIKDIAD